MQLVDRDLLVGADRHDLLRQHVERVARDLRLLDRTVAHAARDHRRLEQVGAELREDPPLRDGAELVAGAPDPLQPSRDRLRRLDLDHEIHRAHVDPELERRGRDQARNLPELEQLFDLDALLAGERAVMRSRDLFLSELVEAQGQPLRQPSVVHEDDRRAVRADELEDLRVDRGPDRLLLLRLAHVVERDDHLEVELLGAAGVDELDLAAARHEPADLLERTLRGREADPLHGLADQPVEPLQRQRQVRAALRARNRVHLVHDHRLDRPKRLARL